MLHYQFLCFDNAWFLVKTWCIIIILQKYKKYNMQGGCGERILRLANAIHGVCRNYTPHPTPLNAKGTILCQNCQPKSIVWLKQPQNILWQ